MEGLPVAGAVGTGRVARRASSPGKDGDSGYTTLTFLFSPKCPPPPQTRVSLPRPSRHVGLPRPPATLIDFEKHSAPPIVPPARVSWPPGRPPLGRETNLSSEELSCLQRVRFLIIFSVAGESSNPGHRAACAHQGSVWPSRRQPTCEGKRLTPQREQ